MESILQTLDDYKKELSSELTETERLTNQLKSNFKKLPSGSAIKSPTFLHKLQLNLKDARQGLSDIHKNVNQFYKLFKNNNNLPNPTLNDEELIRNNEREVLAKENRDLKEENKRLKDELHNKACRYDSLQEVLNWNRQTIERAQEDYRQALFAQQEEKAVVLQLLHTCIQQKLRVQQELDDLRNSRNIYYPDN